MTMNLKLNPSIQSIHLFDFAKDAAPKYFDYVFELMKSIEQELLNRNK
jgi:hypothetical protein